MLRPNWSAIVVLTAGVLLASQAAAQTAISAEGVIESKSGGFQYPDGTVQTSAAVPMGACPTLDPSDEMIWVGGVCIDKYEASIWDAPVGGNQINPSAPGGICNLNGQDCDSIWARSVAGVEPAHYVTWFQAQAALANSGKRLPTNAEWQMAVRGTPDDTGEGTTPCNTREESLQDTGAEPGCVSDFGAFDMVGNVWEWVADWAPAAATLCPGWLLSDDQLCLAGPSPGALLRGGDSFLRSPAGPFTVLGYFPESSGPSWSAYFGFRGAR